MKNKRLLTIDYQIKSIWSLIWESCSDQVSVYDSDVIKRLTKAIKNNDFFFISIGSDGAYLPWVGL